MPVRSSPVPVADSQLNVNTAFFGLRLSHDRRDANDGLVQHRDGDCQPRPS